MKKLAIALAGALFLTAATPVFACPHGESKETAPATADKAKDKDKAKETDTAKANDKAKDKDAGKKKDAPTKTVTKA
jgi:hypothetical protein